MFNRTDPTDALLEENIERVLQDMKGEEPESEKYAAMADQLTKLYAIKNENRSRRVSPDTWATVAANLFGIGIIVGHERTHIVTSKAIGFIRKLF
jgi:hypothetical protein